MKYQTLFKVLAANMSWQEALNLLGITREDAADSDKLKKAYREAARNNHPDMGGSDAKMKLVNEAFEVLEQQGGGLGSGGRFDWEKVYREYRELAVGIKKDLESKFQHQPFCDYFEKLTGVPFTHTVTYWPGEEVKNPSFVSVEALFKNADGSMYFSFRATAGLTDIKHGTGLKGGDLDYSLGITVDAYFNRRKQNLSNERYSMKGNHKLLSDPTILFPEAKLKKLMSRGKATKFGRKDFDRALISELGAKTSKDYYYIPVAQDLKLVIFRRVFMKTAAYMINGLYQGNKRIDMLGIITMPESEETVDFLKSLQTSVKDEADPAKVVESLKTQITQYKTKNTQTASVEIFPILRKILGNR